MRAVENSYPWGRYSLITNEMKVDRLCVLQGLYLRSEHFPPPGVFGSHVTQLNLCLRLGQTEGYLGGHETRPMNPFPVLGAYRNQLYLVTRS